jgi:hypothetical protein
VTTSGQATKSSSAGLGSEEVAFSATRTREALVTILENCVPPFASAGLHSYVPFYNSTSIYIPKQLAGDRTRCGRNGRQLLSWWSTAFVGEKIGSELTFVRLTHAPIDVNYNTSYYTQYCETQHR